MVSVSTATQNSKALRQRDRFIRVAAIKRQSEHYQQESRVGGAVFGAVLQA